MHDGTNQIFTVCMMAITNTLIPIAFQVSKQLYGFAADIWNPDFGDWIQKPVAEQKIKLKEIDQQMAGMT